MLENLPSEILNDILVTQINQGIEVSRLRQNRNSSEVEIVKLSKSIIELIERGANFRTQSKEGFNAMAFAIYASNYELIDFLLKKGYDPLEVLNTVEQTTVLHIAAAYENHLALLLLLKAMRGDNIKVPQEKLSVLDADRNTPLHLTGLLSRAEANFALIIEGADQSCENAQGKKFYEMPLLNRTISNGAEVMMQIRDQVEQINKNYDLNDEAKIIVTRLQSLLGLKFKYQSLPHYENEAKLLNDLIAGDFNAAIRLAQHYRTDFATEIADAKINDLGRQFLDFYNDCLRRGQENRALFFAQNAEEIKNLVLNPLEKDFGFNPKNFESLKEQYSLDTSEGRSLYFRRMKRRIVEGADPNLKLPNGRVLLHLATIFGDLDLLYFLLSRPNIDLDAVDSDGKTALHFAVESNNLLPVLMLSNAIDKTSKTPTEFAKRINRKDKQGLRALEYSKFLSLSSLENFFRYDPRICGALIDWGAKTGFSDSQLDNIYNNASIIENTVADVVLSNEGRFRLNQLKSILERLKIYDPLEITIIRFGNLLDTAFLYKNPTTLDRKIFDDLIKDGIVKVKSLATNQALASSVFMRLIRSVELMKNRNSAEFLFNPEDWNKGVKLASKYFLDAGLRIFAEWSSPENQEVFDEKRISKLVNWIDDKELTEQWKILLSEKMKMETPKTKPVAPIPTKPPAERLKNSMRELQREAVKQIRGRDFENDLSILFSLQASSGESIDTKTTNDWTLFHLVAKLGNSEMIDLLISRGANFGAVTTEGFSVLFLASLNQNREVFKKVLSVKELDLSTVTEDLKEFFKSKNRVVVNGFFSAENIVQKFAELDSKTRANFLTNWRLLNNQNSGAESKNFKETLNDFEIRVKNKVAEFEKTNNSEVNPNNADEPKNFSKKERERIRKEENKKKREEEEKVKLEREKQRELDHKTAVLEKSLMSAEDRRFEKHQTQDFLSSSGKINAVVDLPEFLQPKVRDFLSKDYLLFVKGSAVWGRGSSTRLPSDLDLELVVSGIQKWSDQQIIDFVKENFSVEISQQQIYRGPKRNGSIFTVNFKDDERLLDISIYDVEKLPDPNLGWTHSKEKKIFFKKDGTTELVRPIGLEERIVNLRFSNPKINPERDFFVNTKARGLLMRLCFLQVVGEITQQELNQVLQEKDLLNPIHLLSKELKLDQIEALPNQEQWVRRKITDFANSHNLNEKQYKSFVDNLNSITARAENVSLKANSSFGTLCATLQKMREEISLDPLPSPRTKGQEKLSEVKKQAFR